GGGVIEPVVSLGKAASVLVAATVWARSARSRCSTSLLYCVPAVRLVASTLDLSAATSDRSCAKVLCSGAVGSWAAAGAGSPGSRATLVAPSTPAMAPNAAASTTAAASRENLLNLRDARSVFAAAAGASGAACSAAAAYGTMSRARAPASC